MSTADSWKLLVFRDGRSARSGPKLLRGLMAQIESVLSRTDFASPIGRDELIEALLRAGELECALADRQDCGAETEIVSQATDALGLALVSTSRPHFHPVLLHSLPQLQIPPKLTLSAPEGFCYYALHPLDYADALNESGLALSAAGVIGIRSIGTTLSAVVRGWFSANGIAAERITVRPTGHPFDRCLPLNDEQRGWISEQRRRGAQFLVVDEGPGLSGSSFLAVAEALAEAGVPEERIVLMPSSTPNLESLLAPNAAQRWRRFRTLPLKPTRYVPEDAGEYIGGGRWRNHVFNSESEWTGVWPWTERQKYLSRNGKEVFRFDGHGHYGKTVRNRSKALADHGWGPEVSSAGDGFSTLPWLKGRGIRADDRNAVVQLAQYCSFRVEHFATSLDSNMELEQMVRINLERALGVRRNTELQIERPIIPDARMMPHEWIYLNGGRLQKLDAADHGDNHFFPGPTDIAWDLAGAIVEWKLNPEAAELLVREYRRLANDSPESRLPGYLVAYACLRMAFTQSAANSMVDPEEKERLKREAVEYKDMVLKLIEGAAIGKWT